MNLLPNTGWQINSGVLYCTKYNHQGTGNLPLLSVSGYTTGSNLVTAYCSDTSQLKQGDLVMFSGAESALMFCSMYVDSITPNVSFSGRLPFGLKPTTSTACQARPIACGDYDGTITGGMADGWDKDLMGYWIEDNECNLDVGCVRAAAFKKNSNASQSFWHTADATKFRGQTISWGIRGYQKTGSGGFRVRINDSGTVTNGSTASAGSYQSSKVENYTVSDTCTSLTFLVDTLGANGDVYYFCKPMGNLGATLLPYWPSTGYFVPRVFIGPWVNANFTFNTIGASGRYGFTWMPYQETNGRIAKDVELLSMQWEGRNATSDKHIALTSSDDPPSVYSFVRYSDPVNSMICSSHMTTLKNGSAYFYSDQQGTNWYNASMELNGFVL